MRVSNMFLVLLAVVAIFCNCSIESPTQTSDGGGIETVVSGIVIGSDGNEAPNTQVILFPENFNPVNESIPDSMIDTTDAQGTYTFIISDSLTYNIAAVQLLKRTRLLLFDVKASRDTIFFTDTLKETGIINIELPEYVDTLLGYVFVQGTNIYSELAGNIIAGNKVVIDSVPATTISDICYYKKDEPDSIQLLADTLTVSSGDTSYTQIFGLIEVYNTWNSGLSSNRVCALEKDGNGNIWMGTHRGGLVRFDGKNWTVYDKHNSDLPDDYVYSVAVDNGSVWAGTMKGLAHFDGVNWTIYNKDNSGLVSDSVYVITIEINRTVWIGSDLGLTSFSGADWQHFTTQNSGLPHDIVYSVAIDEFGNKWIGTHAGVSLYDGAQWTVFNTANSGLPDDIVITVTLDDEDTKWIGTFNGGLAKYDGLNWEVYGKQYLKDECVRTIAIDNKDIKWIGTAGCGNIVRYDNMKWKTYDNLDLDIPYIFERINDIQILDNGNIFVATELDGVLVLGSKTKKMN